jgi:hypothetical protein
MRRHVPLRALLAAAAAAVVVTRANMGQPEIRERLQPDLDRYLK